jgi:diguanylate cyclase
MPQSTPKSLDPLLLDLADSVAGTRSLEGLARPLLELLGTVLGMESTYLTTVDEAAGLQHIVYARNSQQLQIPEGLSVP